MFTGIVDHYGEVLSVTSHAQGIDVVIQCQFTDLQLGESIALDGVCVTVVDPQPNRFTCNLSPETMAVTTCGQLKVASKVNLERALRMSDRLSGHIVTGHVDNCCQLAKKTAHEEYWEYNFTGINSKQLAYLVDKGSVAVNGVSLTINKVLADGFSVMLIPHTLQRTNLQELTIGQAVNIEFDYLAKLIAKQYQRQVNTV